MATYKFKQPGAELQRRFDAAHTHKGEPSLADVPVLDLGIDSKVPLVHDQGGVRTLTNVAGKRVQGTGKLRLMLPIYRAEELCAIKVIGYNAVPYANVGTWELTLGGFTSSTGWQRVSAHLISKNKVIKTIKFGAYIGKDCIIIEKAEDWNDVINIYHITANSASVGGKSAFPHSGLIMDLVPNEDGITNIVETPVNWVVTDDGVWRDMVLISGATQKVDSPLRYRKIGNKVKVNGEIYPNTLGNINVATLPLNFRPAQNISRISASSSNDVTHSRRTYVDNQGKIWVTATAIGLVTESIFIDYDFIADA